MDDFSKSGHENKPSNHLDRADVGDGLVFPAYKQFCRDRGFFIPECDIELKLKLEAEAWCLFNKNKPEFSYFQGHVVQFDLWTGFAGSKGFEYISQTVDEFLTRAAKDQAELKKHNKWTKITGLVCLQVCAYGFIFGFMWWTKGPIWVAILAVVVLAMAGDVLWRCFFITRLGKKLEERHVAMEKELRQFGQKLTDVWVSGEIKKHGIVDVAGPKLGEALAEHISSREAEAPGDVENRGYILRDINDLLYATCPAGTNLQSHQLDDPEQLHGYLEASLELPAQILAKDLPNRLTKWLKAEPPPKHADRQRWVEEGVNLLDQARLS